jgi:hypothetical protein
MNQTFSSWLKYVLKFLLHYELNASTTWCSQAVDHPSTIHAGIAQVILRLASGWMTEGSGFESW